MIVRVAVKPVTLLNFDLERSRLLRSSSVSHWHCATLLLVGGETSSTTPVATAITTASREAATTTTLETSTTAETTTATATAAHARDVGALGSHFDVATLEHALVENKSLRDQARLGELDIGVAKTDSVSNIREMRRKKDHHHTPLVDL